MSKRIIMNMDWGDNAIASSWYGGEAYTKDRLRRSVDAWARAGVTDVFWRVSCIGRVNQHSSVEYVNSMADIPADVPGKPSFRPMIEMVQKYDPLEQGVRACREQGLRVYAWLDMFDEYYLPWKRRGRVVEDYPEMQFVDRSGCFYFDGVPNYAYEQVRRFKIRHIEEIAQYASDGIFLSTRSHAKQWSRFEQRGMFGYNEPVLQAYQTQTGVDLRVPSDWAGRGWPVSRIEYNGDPEDLGLLYKIQGEFHTRYLAEVKEVLRRAGQELMVDLGLGEYDGVPPVGLAPFYYDVHRWFDEGIVDAVVPLTYLPGGWGQEQYHTMPEQIDQAGRYARHNAAKVIVWVNVNAKRYPGFESIRSIVEELSVIPGVEQIDGFALHEAAGFEWGMR